MRDYLAPLLFFQRFFLPALLILLAWAVWRTVFKKDLAVGLALYLALLIVVDGFLNTGIYIPGVDKGSIRYSEVCAALLFLNRPPATSRGALYWAVCFFIATYFLLLLLSAFRSTPPMAGILEFRMRIASQIIAFLIAMRGLREPQDYRRFLLCLMTLTIVMALFIFWDLFFDRWLIYSDMLSKPEYWTNRKHGRFGSFFLNPNLLGAFTVLVFPVAFVWTLNERAKWAKALAVAGLLSLAFCLVETQSRGPLLSFAIVLAMVLLGPVGGMSRTRRLGMFLPVFLLFTLLMPGFFEHAAERFASVDQETASDSRNRVTVWAYTRRIIADHPIAGIGFGEQQFLHAMEDYGFTQTYGEESLDNPHNSYLQMTVYAGYPALIAFLLTNALLLFVALRRIVPGGTNLEPRIAFGLAIGVAGFLAVIYPDMHMFTQTVAPVYWVFVGLLLSVSTAQHVAATVQKEAPAYVRRPTPAFAYRHTKAAMARTTRVGVRQPRLPHNRS